MTDKFIKIPSELLKEPDMTLIDVAVYGLVASFKHFFGSDAYIATTLKISERSVRKSLHKLVAMKLIVRSTEGRKRVIKAANFECFSIGKNNRKEVVFDA